MGLADLHLHTVYSFDGTALVPQVLQRACQVGLDVIAITDHDRIEGALQAFSMAPAYGIEVIPGIEITTAEGDLLGLFIHKPIPPGRPLAETILRVGEQGGLCIVPHLQASGLGMKSVSLSTLLRALSYPEVGDYLVGIEVYNATALDQKSIAAALAHGMTVGLNLALVGSSDAHVVSAIGLGVTYFPGHTAGDLLQALRARTTSVVRQSPWSSMRILGTWALDYVGSLGVRLRLSSSG